MPTSNAGLGVRIVGATVAASLCVGCHILDTTHRDVNRGRVLWHVQDESVFGAPAFDGTTVYFAGELEDVVAVDAMTGAIRWRANAGPANSTTGSDAGCAIVGDLVVCGNDGIVAFHRGDGSLAWHYIPVIDSGIAVRDFLVRNGVLYAGSQTAGALYAIDATTGAPRWLTQVVSDTAAAEVYGLSADSNLVAAAFIVRTKPVRGGVVALDPGTGAVRWISYFPVGTFDAPGGGYDTALWSDVVLGSCLDGLVYAFDRTTGAQLWTVPPVTATNPLRGDFRPIAVLGSTLFSGSLSEEFDAFDLNLRSDAWRVPSPAGSASGSPLATDGDAVYMVHANGNLVSYSVTGHSVNWRFGELPDTAFFGTPAIGSDRLFIGGPTGFWAIKK